MEYTGVNFDLEIYDLYIDVTILQKLSLGRTVTKRLNINHTILDAAHGNNILHS